VSDFADDFSERIAAGESPVAVMLSLLPESQRQSLARCAIVRMFDNALYERHLQVGDASLIELLSRGWVEKAAGQKVRYQIAPHLREDAWNLWWQDNPPDDLEPSAELREISARLAEYFAEIDWPMERLRHLVLADVGEAEQLFTQIYQEADQRFDLAYCQDAVDALTDEEITQAVANDPDAVPLDIDWSDAVLVVPPKKQAISIRVDEDVLNFFKKEGDGYQRRINAVLRSYMQQKAKPKKRA